MKVYNPTNAPLDIVIQGVAYHVDAFGELPNVPEEDAKHWKERVHEFIVIKKDDEKKAKEVPVSKEAEEIKEEESVEEVQEDPKESKGKK